MRIKSGHWYISQWPFFLLHFRKLESIIFFIEYRHFKKFITISKKLERIWMSDKKEILLKHFSSLKALIHEINEYFGSEIATHPKLNFWMCQSRYGFPPELAIAINIFTNGKISYKEMTSRLDHVSENIKILKSPSKKS